ncbi:hypothetical protein EN836_32545, partial [Mesorhizobium sp. M1C.F.Ca.ET.193.01.1.1]
LDAAGPGLVTRAAKSAYLGTQAGNLIDLGTGGWLSLDGLRQVLLAGDDAKARDWLMAVMGPAMLSLGGVGIVHESRSFNNHLNQSPEDQIHNTIDTQAEQLSGLPVSVRRGDLNYLGEGSVTVDGHVVEAGALEVSVSPDAFLVIADETDLPDFDRLVEDIKGHNSYRPGQDIVLYVCGAGTRGRLPDVSVATSLARKLANRLGSRAHAIDGEINLDATITLDGSAVVERPNLPLTDVSHGQKYPQASNSEQAAQQNFWLQDGRPKTPVTAPFDDDALARGARVDGKPIDPRSLGAPNEPAGKIEPGNLPGVEPKESPDDKPPVESAPKSEGGLPEARPLLPAANDTELEQAWASLKNGAASDSEYQLLLRATADALLSGTQNKSLFELRKNTYAEFKRLAEAVLRHVTPPAISQGGGAKHVEVQTLEHNTAVRTIINTAITLARAEDIVNWANTVGLNTIRDLVFHATKLDIINFSLSIIVKLRKTEEYNQNLVLRDADHYLSQLQQEWQVGLLEQLPLMKFNRPIKPLAYLSDLVALIYDYKKARQKNKEMRGEKIGEPLEASRFPAAAPGGRGWAHLGVRHYLRDARTMRELESLHPPLLTEMPSLIQPKDQGGDTVARRQGDLNYLEEGSVTVDGRIVDAKAVEVEVSPDAFLVIADAAEIESAERLVDDIRSHEDYTPGQDIVLYVCEAGTRKRVQVKIDPPIDGVDAETYSTSLAREVSSRLGSRAHAVDGEIEIGAKTTTPKNSAVMELPNLPLTDITGGEDHYHRQAPDDEAQAAQHHFWLENGGRGARIPAPFDETALERGAQVHGQPIDPRSLGAPNEPTGDPGKPSSTLEEIATESTLEGLVDPRFRNALAEHIRSHGEVTFADFMNLSLYGINGEGGYYNSGDVAIGRGASDHFPTAPEVSPAFGHTIGNALAEMYQAMGHPDRFDVVEMGAGNGTLARDVIDRLKAEYPDVYRALNYVIVERSQALITRQRAKLEGEERISWVHASADALPLGNLQGVILSNELVDAFPVHRAFRQPGGRIEEIYVTIDDYGRFIEKRGEASPELNAALHEPTMRRLLDRPDTQSEQDLTINVRAISWMKDVYEALDKGFVITFDYGEPEIMWRQPYSFYRKARPVEWAYRYPGAIDMTAKVDPDVLLRLGEQIGLSPARSVGAPAAGFESQEDFLRRHGLGKEINALSGTERHNAMSLYARFRSFFALTQEKNVSTLEVGQADSEELVPREADAPSRVGLVSALPEGRDDIPSMLATAPFETALEQGARGEDDDGQPQPTDPMTLAAPKEEDGSAPTSTINLAALANIAFDQIDIREGHTLPSLIKTALKPLSVPVRDRPARRTLDEIVDALKTGESLIPAHLDIPAIETWFGTIELQRLNNLNAYIDLPRPYLALMTDLWTAHTLGLAPMKLQRVDSFNAPKAIQKLISSMLTAADKSTGDIKCSWHDAIVLSHALDNLSEPEHYTSMGGFVRFVLHQADVHNVRSADFFRLHSAFDVERRKAMGWRRPASNADVIIARGDELMRRGVPPQDVYDQIGKELRLSKEEIEQALKSAAAPLTPWELTPWEVEALSREELVSLSDDQLKKMLPAMSSKLKRILVADPQRDGKVVVALADPRLEPALKRLEDRDGVIGVKHIRTPRTPSLKDDREGPKLNLHRNSKGFYVLVPMMAGGAPTPAESLAGLGFDLERLKNEEPHQFEALLNSPQEMAQAVKDSDHARGTQHEPFNSLLENWFTERADDPADVRERRLANLLQDDIAGVSDHGRSEGETQSWSFCSDEFNLLRIALLGGPDQPGAVPRSPLKEVDAAVFEPKQGAELALGPVPKLDLSQRGLPGRDGPPRRKVYTAITFGCVVFAAFPEHWRVPIAASAYAFRGAGFIVESMFPAAFAPDKRLGRALGGMYLLTWFPNIEEGFRHFGDSVFNLLSNVPNQIGNWTYAGKKLQELLTGKAAFPNTDKLLLPFYFFGSIPSTIQSAQAGSEAGILAGSLIASGSAYLWVKSVWPTERKLDERLVLAGTFGVGLLLTSGIVWKALLEDKDKSEPSTNNTTPSPADGTPPDNPGDVSVDPEEPQESMPQLVGLNLQEQPATLSERVAVLRPGSLVHDTGEFKTDEAGNEWICVQGYGWDGEEHRGWVMAPFVAHHARGAESRGRCNPELESQGYHWVEVEPGQTVGNIAREHSVDVAEMVVLNMDHIVDPTMIFAGDRVYLPAAA